jgi:hypothetical protein
MVGSDQIRKNNKSSLRWEVNQGGSRAVSWHNLPKQPKTQGLYSASTSQIITLKLEE